MTTLLTHAWKRVVDVVPFTFDFTQQLQSGETLNLLTANVSVQVFAGYDPNPSDLLDGGTLVDLTNSKAFIQNLQHGIDGVIYNLIASVQTSQNRIVFQTCKLAVLLQGSPAFGPVIPFYYTSWPYPVEWSEEFQVSISPQGGLWLLNPRYLEQIQVSILPQTSTLTPARTTYTGPIEQIQVSITPQTSTLTLGRIVYNNWPVEQFQVSILPLSSSLTLGRVTYTNPIEQLQVSIAVQGWTLS